MTPLPMWVFVVVAATIAAIAFGLAQVAPGRGMVFVAAATTIWMAFVIARHRRISHDG